MEQSEKPKFVTLLFSVREKLDITWAEYALLDIVYHLSFKTGYCYKTPGYLAIDLGITKRGTNAMIARLIKKGLLERLTDYTLRVTDNYHLTQVSGGKKVPTRSQSGKKVPRVGKKFPKWEQSTPKHYNEHNNKQLFDKNNEPPEPPSLDELMEDIKNFKPEGDQ